MARAKSTPQVTKVKDDRVRNWTFLAYPESAPQNWRSILDKLHIQWVESPLHDKDINEETEEEKKPHWHILLLFEGNKSYEQILEITKSINATVPQKCQSAKGLVRYMGHLDHPEKYQYGIDGIRGHGGADVAEYLKRTTSKESKDIDEMIDWVDETNCKEFFSLVRYAKKFRYDDWYTTLKANSSFVRDYIKSFRHGAWDEPCDEPISEPEPKRTKGRKQKSGETIEIEVE